MKNITKKVLAFGICLNLTFSTAAFADVLNTITNDSTQTTEEAGVQLTLQTYALSDINGHWAESKILEAVDLGIVKGYDDGTFRPDKKVTRAEFATFLTNAIKVANQSSIALKDVDKEDWFYGQVQKSIAAGFFGGYEDNTFRPDKLITRQEVAKVICSTINTGGIDGEGAINLKDYYTIQDWAKPSVNIAFNKGYMMGYPQGDYRPANGLTRAEAVKIIYDILDNENIEYGFNITNSGEIYEGAVVVGDLNILNSVGSGEVYINNVTVLGDINILSDNVNSVILSDVKVKNVVTNNNLNPVTITCNSNIYIENAKLSANAIVKKLGDNIQIKNTIIQ